MNLRTIGLAVFFMNTLGCSQTRDESEAEEVGGTEASGYQASSETRQALGVVRWEASETGVGGFDANGEKTFALDHRTTPVSATETKYDFAFREPGRTSFLSVRAEVRADGRLWTTDVQRQTADAEGSYRNFLFMLRDYEAGKARSSSALATTTLLPTTKDLVMVSCRAPDAKIKLFAAAYIDRGDGKGPQPRDICYAIVED